MTEIVSKLGVELVLEGLAAFRKGMEQARKNNEEFAKSGNVVEKSFGAVNKVLGAFVESLRRIGEFVIAGLIVKGFEKITGAIRDMIGSMITAGMEFQTLTVRLEGLLAREILDTGEVQDFTEALALAGPAAEDLFVWIQKLALTSPFDIQDVAETITFAKAYGFASDQAKILTGSIIDFASGMGLSSVQMKRIIENFGQMIQQGKVTNTELRDLGRGALVPINDILLRMQENLGLTTEEFADLRKEGGLMVEDFIESFIQVVGEDFPNAARRASRTLGAVLGNVNDLIQGLIGFNIVKPILDEVGARMASLLDALTTGDRGERLLSLTRGIGESLSSIVRSFLSLFGGPEETASTIVAFIERMDEALAGFAERFENTIRFLRDEGIVSLLIEFDILSPEQGGVIDEIIRKFNMLRELWVAVLAGRRDASLRTGISATLGLLGFPTDFIDSIDLLYRNLTIAKLEIGDLLERFMAGFQTGGLAGGMEAAGAPPSIIGFIEDIQTALENISTFWNANKEQILKIIDDLLGSLLKTGAVGGETLLEVIGGQLVRFSDTLVEKGPGILDFLEDFAKTYREDLLPQLNKFSDWIIENQDGVANFILIMGLLGKIAPGLLPMVGILILLNPLLLQFGIIIGSMFFIVTQFEDFEKTLRGLVTQLGIILALVTSIMVLAFLDTFNRARDKLFEIGGNIVQAFARGFGRTWDWFLENVWIHVQNLVRRAGSIVGEMANLAWNAVVSFANSFGRMWAWFTGNAGILFNNFIGWLRHLLGISSPSKVFEDMGKQSILGYAKGIMENMNLPEDAMRMAVANTLAPAINAMIPSGAGSTVSTTNNFALNVNSSAQTEPLIADFRLMQSLASSR